MKLKGTGRTFTFRVNSQLVDGESDRELTERERGAADFLNTTRRLSLNTQEQHCSSCNLSRLLVAFKSRNQFINLMLPDSPGISRTLHKRVPKPARRPQPHTSHRRSHLHSPTTCSCAVSAASERHRPPHVCQNRCTYVLALKQLSGVDYRYTVFDLESERIRSQPHPYPSYPEPPELQAACFASPQATLHNDSQQSVSYHQMHRLHFPNAGLHGGCSETQPLLLVQGRHVHANISCA